MKLYHNLSLTITDKTSYDIPTLDDLPLHRFLASWKTKKLRIKEILKRKTSIEGQSSMECLTKPGKNKRILFVGEGNFSFSCNLTENWDLTTLSVLATCYESELRLLEIIRLNNLIT